MAVYRAEVLGLVIVLVWQKTTFGRKPGLTIDGTQAIAAAHNFQCRYSTKCLERLLNLSKIVTQSLGNDRLNVHSIRLNIVKIDTTYYKWRVLNLQPKKVYRGN